MAVETFTRPYDYDPSVTKEVVVAEPHTIPASAPYSVYLRHIPRQQTPSTVAISGASTTWTEVATPPSASGEYRVRYDEALGRIEFHSSDAGKAITVNYNACGTVIWAEDHADGRPNTAEMQEVLERVQEAGGIDYGSSGFANVKAALDALAGVRIVEMGSNSNGEYVRWENGLQVCWQHLEKITVGASTISAQTLTVYYAFYTWTFPVGFISVPATVGSVNLPGATALETLAQSQITTTSVQFHAQGLVTFDQLANLDLIAIGRWK